MGDVPLRTLKLDFGYRVTALRERARGAGCSVRENTELLRMAHKYREVVCCEAHRINGMESEAAKAAKKHFKPDAFSGAMDKIFSEGSSELEEGLNRKIRRLETGLSFSKIARISFSAILGIGALAGGLAIYGQIIEKTSNIAGSVAAGACFLVALASIPLGRLLVKKAYLKAIEKADAIRDGIDSHVERAKKGVAHDIETAKADWLCALRGN